MSGLTTGMTDGSIDIGKLLGAVQGMVGSIGEASRDQDVGGAAPDIGSMISSMMGEFSSGEGGAPPDLAAMIGGLMGNLNKGGDDTSPPDLAAMMGGLMGNLNKGGEDCKDDHDHLPPLDDISVDETVKLTITDIETSNTPTVEVEVSVLPDLSVKE
jgi:hypothetical protein